jgi:glycine oxidase
MRTVARSSDIVVIGAGIIGSATARELARRGASVAVLDRRAPGDGATQASGGMLAPYSEVADGGPLLTLGTRSLALFDQFVGELQDETAIEVGYARSGTLHVARTEHGLGELDALHAALQELRVASERLPPLQTRSCEPNLAEDVRGGLLIRPQGLLSASDLTRALVASSRQHGVRFLEPAAARHIAPSGDGVQIATDRGTVSAGAVVLAAGAWSCRIGVEGAGPLPVRPVRGQLLHLGWTGAPVSRVTWDERTYLVPWSDGTLLVGATVEEAGFDEHATVGGVRGLLDAACGLFPSAVAATLTSVRVGLRPASPDPLPMIGWSERVPRLMYATGHYRNGVLLSPLTAALVADAMFDGGQDPALSLTRPGRFGTY